MAFFLGRRWWLCIGKGLAAIFRERSCGFILRTSLRSFFWERGVGFILSHFSRNEVVSLYWERASDHFSGKEVAGVAIYWEKAIDHSFWERDDCFIIGKS